MKTVRERAEFLFAEARKQIEIDCKSLIANQAAKRELRSGNTAILAVEIYKAHTTPAVDEGLKAVTTRTEHRGCVWRRGIAEIRGAFAVHHNGALDMLAEPLHISIGERQGAREAVNRMLADIGEEQSQRITAFAEGWTSTRQRGWIERHPVIFAIAMLITGAAITKVVDIASDRITGSGPARGDAVGTASVHPSG